MIDVNSTKKTNLMWVEKYRPTNLNSISSHEHIISTIQRLIDEDCFPHLLFYGPPGTGKTSTIIACAHQMYQKNYGTMVLELNASDDRGISVVREDIKNFASTKNIFTNQFKLIILDEADSMTNDAQTALRRVIEQFTKNVRFCLICNNINNIIQAIQSRCTKFRFAPLDNKFIKERIEYIIKQENLKVEEDGINAVVRLASGDMRKAINILQSVSMTTTQISEEVVYRCTGNPDLKDIEEITQILLKDDFEFTYQHIQNFIIQKGISLLDILREIHFYCLSIDFPQKSMIYILMKLADIETRITKGCSDKIQLSSLVACFQQARELATNEEMNLENN